MTRICPTSTYQMAYGEIIECGNSAGMTCAKCDATLCWRHMNLACPNGRKSKMGRMQHLNHTQVEETKGHTSMRLGTVKLITAHSEDIPRLSVSVQMSYQAQETTSHLWAHSGQIALNSDTRGWAPDQELARWFEKKTGENPPSEWRRKRDCVRDVTLATGKKGEQISLTEVPSVRPTS